MQSLAWPLQPGGEEDSTVAVEECPEKESNSKPIGLSSRALIIGTVYVCGTGAGFELWILQHAAEASDISMSCCMTAPLAIIGQSGGQFMVGADSGAHEASDISGIQRIAAITEAEISFRQNRMCVL